MNNNQPILIPVPTEPQDNTFTRVSLENRRDQIVYQFSDRIFTNEIDSHVLIEELAEIEFALEHL